MNFLVNEKKWPTPGSYAFLEVLNSVKHKIDFSNVKTFFECGTGETGDNAVAFSNFFDVVTVENNMELYKRYKDRVGNPNRINFVFGDATSELERYLITNPDERLLILLDDHNGFSSFIKEELQIIKQASNRNDHIIIVDDCNQFGRGTYPTKQVFENLVKEVNKNYIIENTGIGAQIHILFTEKEE